MEKQIKHLNFRIQMLEAEIAQHTQRLEALVKDLKEAVARYDTYSIITFVPGYARQIEELKVRIDGLEEQKRTLTWIAAEEEE